MHFRIRPFIVPKEGPDLYRDEPSHPKTHDFVPIAPDAYQHGAATQHIFLSA